MSLCRGRTCRLLHEATERPRALVSACGARWHPRQHRRVLGADTDSSEQQKRCWDAPGVCTAPRTPPFSRARASLRHAPPRIANGLRRRPGPGRAERPARGWGSCSPRCPSWGRAGRSGKAAGARELPGAEARTPGRGPFAERGLPGPRPARRRGGGPAPPRYHMSRHDDAGRGGAAASGSAQHVPAAPAANQQPAPPSLRVYSQSAAAPAASWLKGVAAGTGAEGGRPDPTRRGSRRR